MKICKYNGRCIASGENIRHMREQPNLSQEQLAAKLQLKGLSFTQKTISRIETGERVVADFELMLLAELFDVMVNDLLEKQ